MEFLEQPELRYRKIPILILRAYFRPKGLLKKIFSWWGEGGGLIFGGGAYTWTNICVLKTLFFVQAIVIFEIFCSQPVFSLFYF